MKVGFIIIGADQMSGGANVIIEYASGLVALGADVSLLSVQKVVSLKSFWHEGFSKLRVLEIDQASNEEFDVVFATWWMTYFELGKIKSKIYAYLNQSYESRFHSELSLKFLNRTTYSLPLLYVTEAKWIKDLISGIDEHARIIYLQNGLSEINFPLQGFPIPDEKNLRIIVEGPAGVPFKRINETFEVLNSSLTDVSKMEFSWLTTNSLSKEFHIKEKKVKIYEKIPIDEVAAVLRKHDILIKLSSVEGMFGPPLEMFSQGGTAITTNVTGHDEYMVHGHNGFIVQPYNLESVSRYLKLLSEDRSLLQKLKSNALETAKSFDNWQIQSKKLYGHLHMLLESGWTNSHIRPVLQTHALTKEPWIPSLNLPFEQKWIHTYEYRWIEKIRIFESSSFVQAFKKLLPKKFKALYRRTFMREQR